MYRTILVPLDGSPLAERAIPFAEALSNSSGARIVLLRAATAHSTLRGDLASEEARAVREAETYLTEVVGRLAKPEAADPATFYGDAADAIAEEVTLRNADIIVMSTHGRSGLGRWVYGSVADDVMRRAEVPVLLVPAATERTWDVSGGLRILVPLDGSVLAEEALRVATDLADATDAHLLLLRTVPPPYYAYADPYIYLAVDPEAEAVAAKEYLDEVARPLLAAGRKVETRSMIGEPASTITSVAQEWKADVIAMATHGSGGLTRLVMGSVATGVVQRSRVPILIVRPSVVAKTAETAAPSLKAG